MKWNQEQPNEVKSFRDEYQFLSNFHPCKVPHNGLVFTNVEAAFQSAKCVDQADRFRFQYLDPVKAKRKGRQVRLRDDWEQVKLSVLTELVRLKFTNNPELKDKLLATGSALLVEGNTWHDNFYGDCTCVRCQKTPGKNHLGRILMELRDKLRTSDASLI